MKKIKNSSGITMISLVVTIIVLIILSTMVTLTGKSSIINSRFERLKNELELVQANVDLWYEKYIDYTYDEIPIGSVIPEDKKEKINENLQNINNEYIIKDIQRYKYFTIDDFDNLQINGIENEYIIDVKKRVAILVEGYEYNEKIYYMLDDVKDVIRSNGDIEEPIRLSSILLKSELEITLNSMTTVTAIIVPNNTNEKLIWSSGDKDYLSIEDVSGKNNEIVVIKANKKGRTTLTVMNEKGTVSTSCEIIITNASK